jgi:NADH-quinone oxidoreductase subunit F
VPRINTLDVYAKHGGYDAFKKALTMTPEAIIEEVKLSGLRGRGGAGFPTHIKWASVPKNRDQEHYLIINADEGEPGTAKDRDLMNHIPHLLVEGCLIGMIAVRASKCYIYIRGEYVEPWQSVQRAINELTRPASSARMFWDRASTSTSTRTWAPAPTSAARKAR